ncbi:hypothetical protein [Marinagarivorans cellulosilyticus]|uniref:hypothetical protein n=1 Tax=Marinagarivorans cellulosilyticus TaxID=2721545 RepID=UPI001F281FD3|nr:hypothetical protein [Marinagarivorans cellulosilyticus]
MQQQNKANLRKPHDKGISALPADSTELPLKMKYLPANRAALPEISRALPKKSTGW